MLSIVPLDNCERMYYRSAMEAGHPVRVSALASGSSGNAYLVEAWDTRLLIEAGLDAARLEFFLRLRGVSPSQIGAIFVSHEHTDHLKGAGTLARKHRIPVVATEGTFLAGASQFGRLPERVVQPLGREIYVGGVTVRTFAVSHDAAETAGFWIEAGGRSIAVCTDLGCITGSILEPLQAADLIILEANHDIKRLWSGPYPPSLKRRVASDRGHLPNSETAKLVARAAIDGRPRTVWLAHLSQVNNTPSLAYEAVAAPLIRDGCDHVNIAVLRRDRPSQIWVAPEQAVPAAR